MKNTKKKVQRIKTKLPNTPNKIVGDILKGQQVTPEVKRRLIFSEAIQQQLKVNFQEQHTVSEKRNFIANVGGKIIKKYRFKALLGLSTSRSLMQKNGRFKMSEKRKSYMIRIRSITEDFFQEDEVSRLCPGKKDTVTFKKVKKQKRYLNASLFNTYCHFKKIHPNIKISYQSFCKCRPFWVLQPNIRQRDTCLCKVHENMTLLTSRAKLLNIIKAKDPNDLLKELCCDVRNENCLERTCETCVNKSIQILEFEKDQKVKYEKWFTKKVEVIIKEEKKICQKTIKEGIDCTKQELLDTILSSLKPYMIHIRNIVHQYKSIDVIKKSLSYDEVLLHMDFSENYNCKYSSEIQSAHFGGSKPQVTLHTVVMYYKSVNANGSETVVPICLCTLSDSMRHDPAAICAHLEPAMKEAVQLVPSINTAFFLSDGPSTQYKNKKMFYLMMSFLARTLKIQKFRWIYSEP